MDFRGRRSGEGCRELHVRGPEPLASAKAELRSADSPFDFAQGRLGRLPPQKPLFPIETILANGNLFHRNLSFPTETTSPN